MASPPAARRRSHATSGCAANAARCEASAHRRASPSAGLPRSRASLVSSHRSGPRIVSGSRVPGRAIVIAAIDNLVKGSSGQAIQNFNLMFGLPETMGLEQAPLFP